MESQQRKTKYPKEPKQIFVDKLAKILESMNQGFDRISQNLNLCLIKILFHETERNENSLLGFLKIGSNCWEIA
jgi:hypothetical protein